MPDPEVTLQLALEHGLLEEEYHCICEILGRTPTFTELGIFSVMWSEHCSYKNSIALIKTLPRDGECLLAKPGEENAGLVDIGDGLAVAFKMESHNHPSAVEPYQGAATGVGGIMRDIFTMGARPIAALNSLRFGPLEEPRVRYLFNGIVRGIADYGNCFGIPTVAGEIYFEDAYRANPLVNVMAVGIVKHDRIARAVAKGPGNPVILIGSSTGRDGIHGATFASEEISEKSEGRRPQVQVGDPFTEKLLLEATLEMIKAGLVVGIQDMGAAGITCSTCETAARANSGVEIELAHVPLREKGMTAYEIMLSESQERMLVIAPKGREDAVRQICQKWDLNCAILGHVTDDDMLRVKMHGEVVAEIPAQSLVVGGGAPVYHRLARRPRYLDAVRAFDPSTLPEPEDYNAVLLRLMASPNIASKEWVYQQYDHMVRTNTVVPPGSDAAVLRIKGTRKAVAMKTDCNGRYCYLNPRRGAAIAVAESARNVVCAGARPVAITDCLNFGNPYDPEIFWQFQEAIAGIREACLVLGTPVTGGNVSFYNEGPEGAVYPTPVIGMLGLVEDLRHITTAWFKREGDVIVLLGELRGEVGGTEYLKTIHGRVAGDCPGLDLELEVQVQRACLEAIRAGIVHSAHDLSDGGLAVALAEGCIMNEEAPLGARIALETNLRLDAALFGESQSCIVVSLPEEHLPVLRKIVERHRIPFTILGRVAGDRFSIAGCIDVNLHDLQRRYRELIAKMMEIEI